MTRKQKQEAHLYLSSVLDDFPNDSIELHHGMCIGADDEINDIARSLTIWTVGHPPTDTKKMSSCIVDEILPPLRYLDRNWNIALGKYCLIAAPKEFNEILRSGTWATVRYATQMEVPIKMLWPWYH